MVLKENFFKNRIFMSSSTVHGMPALWSSARSSRSDAPKSDLNTSKVKAAFAKLISSNTGNQSVQRNDKPAQPFVADPHFLIYTSGL